MPNEPPSRDIPDLAVLQRRLTSVLSAVAGAVDVISFVSLKLFAAHITGNLVVIAAMLVTGGPPRMDQILAVPVFLLAVAVVWLIADWPPTSRQCWPCPPWHASGGFCGSLCLGRLPPP